MTKNNKNRKIKPQFTFVADRLKTNKMFVIIISVVLFITFLTGIIVAIKTKIGYENLEKLGVVCFKNSGFLSRLFSMLIVALICFGCSFSKWLSPLAMLFLSYRAYLLGINICLIISTNGIAGIVTALIIVLPCQLLTLCALALLFLLHRNLCKQECGFVSWRGERIKIIVFILILLFSICLIESILFAIFSPTIILVI